MNPLQAGQVIDQYQLIRIIGQGGFGTVWLVWSDVLRGYFALKIIDQVQGDSQKRELKAVQTYKKLAVGSIRSGLLPIEHVGVKDKCVFYVMPLADGLDDSDPRHSTWKPATLAAHIENQRNKPTWFTAEQISNIMAPICSATQILCDAGVVHRDIKPENILFIQGQPVLSDVSLLTADTTSLTRLGTPGFTAPSWYTESGGKIDMYSIVTTFYTLLTGNPPDKMGRAAFRWPPQGNQSLDTHDRPIWPKFHRIIMRATHEKHAERYISFDRLGDAIQQCLHITPPRERDKAKPVRAKSLYRIKNICGALIIITSIVFATAWITYKTQPKPKPDTFWVRLVKVVYPN